MTEISPTRGKAAKDATQKPPRRRADKADRERALQWAGLYRLAQKSPEGRYCVNPESCFEEQAFIYADDVSFLVSLLENFSKHGTFATIDDMGIDGLIMRQKLEALRIGETRLNAVADLSIEYGVSESTISRRVKTVKT